MRALVTGSAGFVGNHLCPALENKGYAIDRIDPADPVQPCTFQDWRQRTQGSAIAFDIIVHLGANIMDVDRRTRGGIEAYEDLALDYEVCRYVQDHPPTRCFCAMSSCATVFPEDPYAWIKLTLERLCERLHRQGIPVVILRPFSGYGHDQKSSYPFPAILARAMNREDPLVVWGGPQVRDWIHIDDLVNGILHCIEKGPRGVPIQLGSGIGTTLFNLAQKMANAIGYAPEIRGDLSKATASAKLVADPTFAESIGWQTTISLEDGIRRSIEALCHNESA